MNPINRLLKPIGLHLGRTPPKPPREFREAYRQGLSQIGSDPRGFQIHQRLVWEAGDHPKGYRDYECEFAARHIQQLQPRQILDIGSYRWFILGMLAGYQVTTVDVRERKSSVPNETVISADARKIPLPDASFDAVTSLCAIEHFGLGRYGDPYDPAGDVTAMQEMIRVLRPGGHLVFTTQITRGAPTIVFNAHRIYTRALIHELCKGLELVEEGFFSFRKGKMCTFDEVDTTPGEMDIYMGKWRKPGRNHQK